MSNADAYRAAMTILRLPRRVRPDDLRALAVAYLETVRDLDIVRARAAELAQHDRNIDEERARLRNDVMVLAADASTQREHIANLHQTVNALTRRVAELEPLEQAHRQLATLAMHARTWRHAQMSDRNRSALIDAVDALAVT